MKMLSSKSSASQCLELFETLQRPGRTFSPGFFGDLLYVLLREDRIDDAMYILRRTEGGSSDVLEALSLLLPPGPKLRFSDRRILANFDLLRDDFLDNEISPDWTTLADQGILQFRDK